MLKTYGDKVRLVVKHTPYRYRDYSRIAAEASLSARDQGKFREMHLLLLERSPALARGNLIAYARELSLDVARFTKDIDGMTHTKEIDRDGKLAERLDLYTTPAFFVNGIKILGDRPFESFREVIDRELAILGAGKGKR
ncbi:MAG: thioredoxin domain-containing protein [Deltaproteobacteria bacterium]|nr:thioredoxin domain-containing protein [Deltaproteobacteria bacterium]